MGKTIQAGMLPRQVWLSGWAQRILVMAPKAVLSQWQIELREKLNLNWPIYDGQRLRWYASPGRYDAAEHKVGPRPKTLACTSPTASTARRRATSQTSFPCR